MENKTKKGLLDAERLVKKIKRKVRRNDLDYTIQSVIDSTAPGKIRYAARITPLNEASAPMTFIADTIDQLVQKLEYRLNNGLEPKELEVTYHEHMVKNLTSTINYHEQKIKELKEENKDDSEEE